MTAVSARVQALTGDGLLKRNVILNLLGWALPAAAAFISIPMLARGLGAARFGLVAIAWSSVSLFSLFDFGLGRALTRIVAERLAASEDHAIADLVWSASWLLLGLTSGLAVAGFFAAPQLVDHLLHVPVAARREAISVLRLIAVAIPPLAHGVALRGVLEAGQQYRMVNQLRVPLGIATYAGPLVAIPLGASATVAVGMIVGARVLYWIAHFFVLDRVAPAIGRLRGISRVAVHELARVGGWITVSTVLGPAIVQADRVVVAAGFPIAASGWYGTAAEVATKQWLFTAALQPVLFSALSAAIKPAPERAVELLERATRITLLALLPVAALLAAFAQPGLELSLRSAYSPAAGPVLRWMAIAVYINAVAQVPYAALQGGVDARSVAMLHVLELPIYLVALVASAHWMGLRGVAFVWFARMAVDGAAMWWLAYRKFHLARPVIRRLARYAIPCAVTLALAAAWGGRSA
jgi:O-antigen/teichoic acid export membrane protein